MPELSEHIAVMLPSKNDREAYNALFRNYFARLLAYAELFTDKENARDIVQDLMVYLWDHSDKISIHTSLEAYLFRSVYRRCLNHLQHEKVIRQHSDKTTSLYENEYRYYDPESNPVIVKIFSQELHREIEEAIASLPDKCRQAFISSYIDGLKTKEIAAILNITERTAETHIYHALKVLRSKLKDKFFLIPWLF